MSRRKRRLAAAPIDPDLGAPVIAPRTWRYRVTRAAKVVAIVTASTLVLGSGAAFGYYKWLESIAPVPVSINQPVPGASPRPPVIPGGAVNFLLLGSDSRDDLTAAELADLGTEAVGGRRTDTIILLHLSADRKKTVLVSFPRDSWVDIPGYGKGRINTAFGRGGSVEAGANVLRATVEQLTGIRVDHYIEVDFRGFLDVVRAIDGVEICLSRDAYDPMAGLNLKAGTQVVKGVDALAFVRARHFDPRSDFGRIERQQKFLAGMLRKATSSSVLLNPVRLNDVLTSSFRAVRRDSGLGLRDIKDLVDNLDGLDPSKVTFLTAPVERTGPSNDGPNPASVVFLDTDAGRQLWEAIRTDGPLPGAAPLPLPSGSASPTLSVAPASITLDVLNGTETKGLARRAANDLRAAGFSKVRKTADADSSGYLHTIVRHGHDDEEAARTVAAALPGALLQEDASLEDTIEVVVGADYSPAVPVASPSPTATPKPKPRGIVPAPFDTRTAAQDPCD